MRVTRRPVKEYPIAKIVAASKSALSHTPGWVEAVVQDVRYAFRGFRRNPVFTIGVLLTLALGIGTTTAVFSVVDRILFRPLPYADPSRIVSVGFSHSLERQEFLMGRSYVKWRDNQRP